MEKTYYLSLRLVDALVGAVGYERMLPSYQRCVVFAHMPMVRFYQFDAIDSIEEMIVESLVDELAETNQFTVDSLVDFTVGHQAPQPGKSKKWFHHNSKIKARVGETSL